MASDKYKDIISKKGSIWLEAFKKASPNQEFKLLNLQKKEFPRPDGLRKSLPEEAPKLEPLKPFEDVTKGRKKYIEKLMLKNRTA